MDCWHSQRGQRPRVPGNWRRTLWLMRHLLLDTLAAIIAASVEHNLLAPRELILVRLAALIAWTRRRLRPFPESSCDWPDPQ